MAIKKLLVCIAVLFCFVMQAQDELKPLGGNAVLMQAWKKRQEQAQTAKGGTMQTQAAAVFLPFADDFSYFGPYPDPTRWVNSTSIFVNHTKATKPITIGVATFDGMMGNGYPYNGSTSTGNYPSDTLTSVPIRLDSLNGVSITPSDSVRLRFYYQPRGLWERPDNGDELILEFYNPTTAQWGYQWSKNGYNPFTDSSFKRVIIAITDTAYLKNGFQFRFRNYSTACGDVDHWHVDAVYMDKGMDPNKDTIVPEISFSYDLNSLLKNYSQMPFNQFLGAADMQSNFNAYYNLRNNYTTAVNVSTYYQVNNNVGASVAQNYNGSNNIYPYADTGYCADASLVNPSLNSFTYNGGPFADSTSFLLKFYATNISDNFHSNDTVYYRQNFHNYFAYDDGSAEAGYGFTAAGGFTAVRYKLNAPDTLRSIDVFFDPILAVSQLENAGIRFYVWSDNGGLPGTVLFMDSARTPMFSQNGYNLFQRYQLADTVIFNTAATFYIGIWQQLNLSLNVGYDLNTDAHTNVLFNTGSGWNVSSFKGSLMMRPVFGDSLRAVGIENHTVARENILVYPNPAADVVYVKTQSEIMNLQVCDLLGNILLEERTSKINTASLPNGMYLIKTCTVKGFAGTQKLIIAR